MKVTTRISGKGLTLIELLVLLAVLAVLVAFTSPVLRDHHARAKVQEATLQVALALHNAKNVARTNNTMVTVLFTAKPSGNTISFEIPNDSKGADGRLQTLAGVILPATVSVSSTIRALTFGPRGIINATDRFELALAAGTDFFAKVTLNPALNRVKTSYGQQTGLHKTS